MKKGIFQILYLKEDTLSDLDLLYGCHHRVMQEYMKRFRLLDKLYINEFINLDSKDLEEEFILERIPILERLVPFSILKILTSRGSIKYLYNDEDINLIKLYLEVCVEGYNEIYDDIELLKFCKNIVKILPNVSDSKYVIEDYGIAMMFKDFILSYYKDYRVNINPMINVVILEIIRFYIGKIHGVIILDELVEVYKKIIIYCEIQVYGYIVGQIRAGFTIELINDLVKYYNEREILANRPYLRFVFFYIKEAKVGNGISRSIGSNELIKIEERLLNAYENKLKGLINSLK